MFEFHKDLERYFAMNTACTAQYIIPFIEARFRLQPGMRVLEIGCGEGGVLKAFIDKGLTGVGIELIDERLQNARQWMQQEIQENKVVFLTKNIYDSDAEKDMGGRFDIIILKDVIEHIVDQSRLLQYMHNMLQPGGVIFFGFPPWQMPYGGHQQLLKNKILSALPYYHMLPMGIYKKMLSMAKENVQEMTEIKETGISIERFEKIVKSTGYEILEHKHFLINPMYKYKFGWKPRTQLSWVQHIPVVRNFVTTCVYYLITPKKNDSYSF